MFNKILIANRGEIACRIITTAHRLGIQTVAVYSEVDSKAKHVMMANEAFCIGPAPASESYLVAENIINIALESGAEAIHPGYGFLSENFHFAALCKKNKLIFIGPSVDAIKIMGSKSAAKQLMDKANVPLVPGYHGDDQSLKTLRLEAKTIGFPVLLKAVSGGGGKGMRIVESEAEFSDALLSCQREAKAAFSDDTVIIEKYLLKPRHVEIQIFADNFGNIVHLFERDCSVQRRHQKIIEEAPAPNLSTEVRAAMYDVAITAAKVIGYSGAGTIEFLYDQDGKFYFMEMNTRLQVEHPVTEMVTGIDLVEWQLLVANEQKLPLQQQQINCNGHAFEVRIYAEDPERDFLPVTGKVIHLKTPKPSTAVRIDTAVVEGDEISIYYDPMIAKLIVWGEDRKAALVRLSTAIADYQLVGFATNLNFLSTLAANDAFKNSQIDTSFIEQQQDKLFGETPNLSDQSISLAALYILQNRVNQSEKQATQSPDPYSPWHQVTGWLNNQINYHEFEFIDCRSTSNVTTKVHFKKDGYSIDINDKSYSATAKLTHNRLSVNLSGQRIEANVIEHDDQLHILTHGRTEMLKYLNHANIDDNSEISANLTAPMPGTVIAVKVKTGQTVVKDQSLLIIEAMKMEHTIRAPHDGIISGILYQSGEKVEEGAELMIIGDLV